MFSTHQNHSDEKTLVDCVQRFFVKHYVEKFLFNIMKQKKKCFICFPTALQIQQHFCWKKYVSSFNNYIRNLTDAKEMSSPLITAFLIILSPVVIPFAYIDMIFSSMS